MEYIPYKIETQFRDCRLEVMKHHDYKVRVTETLELIEGLWPDVRDPGRVTCLAPSDLRKGIPRVEMPHLREWQTKRFTIAYTTETQLLQMAGRLLRNRQISHDEYIAIMQHCEKR